jgi:hypothetical protein
MYVFAVVAFVVQIMTAVILIREYRRSKAIGYLWLAVVALGWPLFICLPQVLYSGTLVFSREMVPGALYLCSFT